MIAIEQAKNIFPAIYDKVMNNQRLDFNDGVELFQSNNIHAIGALSNYYREKLHKSNTYYIRNRHINFTNVCDKHCLFCSFYAQSGGPEPYLFSAEEIQSKLLEPESKTITEVHMVGGAHPTLPFDYYLGLLKGIKKVRPDIFIKAFTAVEIAQMSKISGYSYTDVIAELKKAGLDCVPGGGAEILSDRIHNELYPNKLTPNQWLEVSRAVAQNGIKQYATMLYGHIETVEERVEHLIRLRELQDETNNFLALTPLSFHPENTKLSQLPGPGGIDDIKTIAVSRLMLDNIPHIKTFWVMNSPAVSQIALCYGADDIDGTVFEYEITFTDTAVKSKSQRLTVDGLKHLISETGRTPIERDTFYNVVNR